MSYFERFDVAFADSGSLDAFARLRTSSPSTLFDSKQLGDSADLYFDDAQVSGSGTTSTYSNATASTVLAVSATTAGRRVRQTYERFNYQPGKSQFVVMTYDDINTTTGLTKCLGYYDDDNGLFLQSQEGVLSLVVRSSTSGSPVDTVINQSSWNVDQLDGTGPSGLTLDTTKANIFFLDYEWLGVGRVRFGFYLGGHPIVVHAIGHANTVDEVYMSTPNLPVRYEIENDGSGAAAELESICSTVVSEGGFQETGITRSINRGGTDDLDANTVGTAYLSQAIRLKTDRQDSPVKIKAISILSATNDDYLWEIRLNPTLGGALTWNGEANSSVEGALGDNGNTVTGGTVIASGYDQGNSSQINVLNLARNLGIAIDGTRDVLALVITPMGSNLDIYSSITYLELA